MKYSTALFLIFALFTISLLLVSLRGCAPEPEPPVGPPSTDSCATGRWIGIVASPGNCPEVPDVGWSTGPLFASVDPGSTLGSYCLYEHDDPTRGDVLERLVVTGDLERVGPDCAEVFVAGTWPTDGVTETLMPTLAPQFAAQAGAVSLPAGTGSVRLAILDTSPPPVGSDFVGNSEHGASLAYMARELLCQAGDDACAATVTTRLALTVVSFDPNDSDPLEIDETNGGYFGTLGQLAIAINEEVSDWSTAPEAEERLVLNLSLGWNPRPEGADGTVDIDEQAVLDALRSAACRGVLVVAAAGNLGSGPDARSGPILPAAWQSKETPATVQVEEDSLLSCMDFEDDGEPNPLLYAAGAVDSRGLPLSNHRPGAEPAWVAYGSHSVAAQGDEWTGIYSGTSVSTAVISATAAAVWHYQDLTRRELMIHLYVSGGELNRTATFDSEDVVHRISLCGAVAGLEDVPALANLDPCPSWSSSVPSLFYEAEDWNHEYDASVVTKSIDPDTDNEEKNDDCPQGEYRHPEGYLPNYYCPFRDIPGIDDHPLVGPQPEDIPCPSCPLVKNPDPDEEDGKSLRRLPKSASCPDESVPYYTLFVEIDPDYQGGTLTDATLRIDNRFYLLDLGELGPGNQVQVLCIDGSMIDPATSTADLTFAAAEHGSVMNVVPISGDG